MSWWHNERARWAATAAVIGLVIVVVMVWTGRGQTRSDATLLVTAAQPDVNPQPIVSTPSSPAVAPAPSEPPLIGVDVIGAVQQPGVYYLPPTARVDDAVNAAGGLAPDADRERVNMAAHLADGEQIRIPRVGDIAAPVGDEAAEQDMSAPRLIDINTADATTLGTLPGIGPATADAIIAYRTQNGPFKRVEDIDNVKGIGPALLADLLPLITVAP
jgi:competence protein ComEA